MDWLIRGGRLVDGTGNPWYCADLAVERDRIAAVGRLNGVEARQRLDVDGLVLAPGFIDSHTHSEAFALARPEGARVKVAQGVTTEFMGLCGLSAFPVMEGCLAPLQEYLAGPLAGERLSWRWQGYAGLAAEMRSRGLLLDTGSLVGHGSLRLAVMGSARRHAASHERAEMQALAEQALDEGAAGISFGLVYPPGCFADQQELLGLARVAARKGRPCCIHMRDEGNRLLESVEETVDLARESGCRFVISHLKAAGPANWGKVQTALETIERARSEGLDLRTDAYPYLAGCPWITALLPPWVHEGGLQGMLERLEDPDHRRRIAVELAVDRDSWENLVRVAGWDRIVLLTYPLAPEAEGQNLAELAEQWGKEPADVLMDIVLESKGQAQVAVFDLGDQDVEAAVSHSLSMIVSDGGPSPGLAHPRLYGTFPRVLGEYVRLRGTLRLEEAVRKMTSYVAQTYNLMDRGLIQPGLRANLVVFDPEVVEDRATYDQPNQYPAGIRAVFVGGQLVMRDGEPTGVRPGEPVLI